MKPKVYITRKLSDDIIRYISNYCDVRMWQEEDTPVPREILKEEIKEIDGLFSLLTDSIDCYLIDQAKNLKVVSNMAVGYNNIDSDYAMKKGIAVTNTPGVLTETTADLTFALLMAAARRINEAEFFLRDGNWKTWSPMLLTGQDIYGATIGIIGLGRIGQAVARRARGFDMKVVYHNRRRLLDAEKTWNVEYKELEELLQVSDYICVMTPFTPETKDLISFNEFSLMKNNAILINTSRGGIVNEEALYEALVTKKIWGAGLDVFEEEPLNVDHPLLTLPNVVLTPHIGSASIQTRLKMAKLAADNMIDVLQGRDNRYVVNDVSL
ncbi:2-hydroxyacid dehydrogenase [Evansella tamaricis]|uniref:D-glycerate dehydrogenase n=1 Tax=Evansella tamaricis TaxID=2069301 RepID=A0ABS6JD98_9BACI|nr:D-glycerate dehydrogenase [Evansella tamaricis]MBU9711174.1 D-glycerate dehydrogenase [Evansella tamaricis]